MNNLTGAHIQGVCPKCLKVYFGWAIRNPIYRKCECGGKIYLRHENTEVQVK